MSEILAALVGAVATLAIPLVAWTSQRLTREGRLLMRVTRLGTALAVMPESPERAEFEAHVRRTMAKLNEWIAPPRRFQRTAQYVIGTVLYVVGVGTLLAVYKNLGTRDPVATTLAGVLVGVAVAASTMLLSSLIGKVVRRRDAVKASVARLERFRRGDPTADAS